MLRRIYLMILVVGVCSIALQQPVKGEKPNSPLQQCNTEYNNCFGTKNLRELDPYKSGGRRDFTGEWKNGRPNGFGVLINYNERKKYVGYFKSEKRRVGMSLAELSFGEIRDTFSFFGARYSMETPVAGTLLSTGLHKSYDTFFSLSSIKSEPVDISQYPYYNPAELGEKSTSFVLIGSERLKPLVNSSGETVYVNRYVTNNLCFSVYISNQSRKFFESQSKQITPSTYSLNKNISDYLYKNSKELFGKIYNIHQYSDKNLELKKCDDSELLVVPYIDAIDVSKNDIQAFNGQGAVSNDYNSTDNRSWVYSRKINTVKYDDIFLKENEFDPKINSSELNSLSSFFVKERNYSGSVCTTMASDGLGIYSTNGYIFFLIDRRILDPLAMTELPRWTSELYQSVKIQNFQSLDQALDALQSAQCSVFVDKTNNINKISNLLDNPQFKFNVGNLERGPDISPKTALAHEEIRLRDLGVEFAKFEEFDFVYSTKIEANQARSRVARLGVKSVAHYNDLMNEMNASGYELFSSCESSNCSSRPVSPDYELPDYDLRSYLKDKKIAEQMPGATPVSIQQARFKENERKAAALAEQRQLVDSKSLDGILLEFEWFKSQYSSAARRGFFCLGANRSLPQGLAALTRRLKDLLDSGYKPSPSQKLRMRKEQQQAEILANISDRMPTKPSC